MKGTALLALVVLLAGCTAFPVGGPGPSGPVDARACQPTDVPRTDDANASPAYPERPPEFTRLSAREYAVAFERAFAWHRTSDGDEDEVHVNVGAPEVERVADGFVVRIESVSVSTRTGNEVGSDAWSAFYRLTASAVRRGEGHAGAPAEAPPRSDWTVVCG